ncbi:MAG: helix-turn-helix domain-containing protein [Defluviitaleaceae bacterium]|nr:helix-turn-helix domain-containing protein [Defluviitaleaceae bacterium]
METIDNIQKSIDYMEENIVDELEVETIARQACMSVSHFQRMFLAVCGVSVGDYIRNRRLALAGGEVVATKVKIIDIANKYGYDSPEGFSRAFRRFHNTSPSTARSHGDVNTFAKISLLSMLRKEDDMEDNNNTKDLSCSFCKKHQDEVQFLVTDKKICICEECIVICSNLIEVEMSKAKPG